MILVGSPPLTREIQLEEEKQVEDGRITPAYAGNTVVNKLKMLYIKDHPRLRGKYFYNPLTHYTEMGSPPLTREILTF